MIRYAKSHIWVSLIGSMILLFLGLAVIFQNYLKNEYFNYLIAETWKSEQTVLSVASKNLNGLLLNVLHVGSEADRHGRTDMDTGRKDRKSVV